MNGYNVLKYGATGIAAPDMTAYDKLMALRMHGSLPITTITGVPPIRFRSDGSPLDNVSIIGNGQQTGTPAQDAPIYPDFVGTLSGGSWTVTISCDGQIVTADLSHVQTVRKIRKLVLTGNESWSEDTQGSASNFFSTGVEIPAGTDFALSSHFKLKNIFTSTTVVGFYITASGRLRIRPDNVASTSKDAFTAWLATQYANGTPVAVWYALAEPTTGIVNEPLCKIGNYADTLDSADAGVTIPTAKGANVLTVDTDLQPSNVSITGHIKPL